jgi:hypothetical protein
MSVLSTNGVRLHKRMQVKIFPPAGRTRTIKLRAPAGKWITAEGIDQQLGQVAEGIEKAWPRHEFRMVPIGPAAFNFVCAGEKKIDSELTTTEREVVTSTPLPLTKGSPRAALLPQALPCVLMLVLMVLFLMALLAVGLIAYLLDRYHGMKAAESRQREREELKRR